jgi:hypothetical protein
MGRVDGRPAPVRPEPRRYGRPNHRPTAAAPAPQRTRARTVPAVTADTIAEHLYDRHGVPDQVLAGATATEMLGWHAAEHRHRLDDHLGHTHTDTATTETTTSDPIHAANLKALRDGKQIPNLEEILERAAYAQARRLAGRPLSIYDRQCIELERVVAERAARRARRRGAA